MPFNRLTESRRPVNTGQAVEAGHYAAVKKTRELPLTPFCIKSFAGAKSALRTPRLRDSVKVIMKRGQNVVK